MMDNAFLKKENKKYIIYAILAIIVIVVIVFLNISFGSVREYHHEHADDGVIEEETDSGAFVTMRGLEFLGEFIKSTKATNFIMNSIQDEILNDVDSDQSQVYTATLLSRSLIKSIYDSYVVSSFVMDVSNEKSYNIQIALKDGDYFGLLIKSMNQDSNKAHVYVAFLRGLDYFGDKRKSAIDDIVKWAKTIAPGELSLTTKDL